MSRVTLGRLLELGADLSERERWLTLEVAKLRLVSHTQLGSLLEGSEADASPPSAARSTRRILMLLTDVGVLARLERRVGGIRAGSSGYVYYLGPVGQRLIAYWEGQGLTRGRFRPEPRGRHVRHRLAVSQLYVQARSAERQGLLDLLSFDGEPACWRTSIDGFGGRFVLKPDAHARIGVGAYENSAFVEVDLATESRSVIARKCRAYVDYWRSGQEQAATGIFPRVLWLTTTEARVALLVEVCSGLPADAWELFTVGRLERGLQIIAGQIEDDIHRVSSDGDAP